MADQTYTMSAIDAANLAIHEISALALAAQVLADQEEDPTVLAIVAILFSITDRAETVTKSLDGLQNRPAVKLMETRQ